MMQLMNFYSNSELKTLGLKSFGKNVLISKKCSIYNAQNIRIGSNVRIDDFCILSGKIEIGNYVHISAGVYLYGKGGIKIGNFCGISPKSTIFSASDDFSGEYMISPMAPDELTNVHIAPVIISDFVQVGCNSVILPGVVLGQGCVIGAMSLVKKNLDEWSIYVGIPTKKIKNRQKNILEISKKLRL